MINNNIYDQLSDTWWSENGFLNLLQSVMNPWRVPYFKRILERLDIAPRGMRVLDAGCGGGLLTEEFAALGFAMTGIDRSEASLQVARAHAVERGLTIDYRSSDVRQIPFEHNSFNVIFCCDVLEHIENWGAVVSEIARVLEHGGILFYDTINRTPASKLRTIKLAQEWSWTRYAPPNTHIWEMFITPEELGRALNQSGLQNQEMRGTAPKGNPLQALWLMRQFKTGKISAAEFGQRIDMTEGNVLSGSYMGYAINS